MSFDVRRSTFDVRRLRLHGPITRAVGTNSYTLTPEGIRVAVIYTKLHARLLRLLLESDKPPAPIELHRALGTIEQVIEDYVANARLGVAWNLSQDPETGRPRSPRLH
jgi:hypothetical protein